MDIDTNGNATEELSKNPDTNTDTNMGQSITTSPTDTPTTNTPPANIKPDSDTENNITGHLTDPQIKEESKVNTPRSVSPKKESHKSTPTVDPVEFGPVHEYVGGSSLRRYLNEHVTKELMKGLKQLAQERPKNPLKWLGEYLIEASKAYD